MKISKAAIVCCFAAVFVTVVLFLTRDVLYAPTKIKPGVDIGMRSITNNYSFSEIRKFPAFPAKLEAKHTGNFLNKKTGQTNYFVTIILERGDGDELSVSDNYNTSQNLLLFVNTLEKGRRYTFPDVLMLATNNSPVFVH